MNDSVHTSFATADELAASTVNIKMYFWVPASDFRHRMLKTRSALMRQVKTKLEAAGFNLPANITELKFYNTSAPVNI